jgi:hypothetical protein
MAYNPLRLTTVGDDALRVNSVATQPLTPRTWTYQSADAVATVRAANYFSDAKQRGMKVNDLVFVVVAADGSAATAVSICVVMAVAATGADLSDGTSITVTNT